MQQVSVMCTRIMLFLQMPQSLSTRMLFTGIVSATKTQRLLYQHATWNTFKEMTLLAFHKRSTTVLTWRFRLVAESVLASTWLNVVYSWPRRACLLAIDLKATSILTIAKTVCPPPLHLFHTVYNWFSVMITLTICCKNKQ